MYLNGVSTRKVNQILEQLCGFEISRSEVSHCTQALRDEIEQWRQRPLTENYRYVYLDAHYQKVRQGGSVQSMAVLMAVGINSSGYREVIGVSAKLSEATSPLERFF